LSSLALLFDFQFKNFRFLRVFDFRFKNFRVITFCDFTVYNALPAPLSGASGQLLERICIL